MRNLGKIQSSLFILYTRGKKVNGENAVPGCELRPARRRDPNPLTPRLDRPPLFFFGWPAPVSLLSLPLLLPSPLRPRVSGESAGRGPVDPRNFPGRAPPPREQGPRGSSLLPSPKVRTDQSKVPPLFFIFRGDSWGLVGFSRFNPA